MSKEYKEDTRRAKMHADAERFHKILIDILLKSPLNISVIPDDLEREMYELMFEAVEHVVIDTDYSECVASTKSCFKSCFGGCCRKKREKIITYNAINEN